MVELLNPMLFVSKGLDDNTVEKSVQAITDADLLIVGGTSLNVYGCRTYPISKRTQAGIDK